jgi:hypothetical protein
MRNSYLAALLSKHHRLRKEKKVYTDEYSLQSIFMILQEISSEEKVRSIISRLPRSHAVILFERNKKKRYTAYKLPNKYKESATLLPASWIDMDYAEQFMNIMEINFQTIKKIIEQDYSEKPDMIKDILQKLKTYKKKDTDEYEVIRDLVVKPPRFYMKKDAGAVGKK